MPVSRPGARVSLRNHGHGLDGPPHLGQDGLQLADHVLEPADAVLQGLVNPSLHRVLVEVVANPDVPMHLADAVDMVPPLAMSRATPAAATARAVLLKKPAVQS